MISIDFDPSSFLDRDLTLLVNGFQDARDGGSRETQEENCLT